MPPPPEPAYLPAPEPTPRSPEELAAVERMMDTFRRTIAERADQMREPFRERPKPAWQDDEALRRGRVDLGLEPEDGIEGGLM